MCFKMGKYKFYQVAMYMRVCVRGPNRLKVAATAAASKHKKNLTGVIFVPTMTVCFRKYK